MALPNMVTGADCSAGQNPLAQAMKQFTEDRSLQRDHFAGPSQSAPLTMRTGEQQVRFQQGEYVDDFFESERHSQLPQPMHTFEFSRLQQELEVLGQPPYPQDSQYLQGISSQLVSTSTPASASAGEAWSSNFQRSERLGMHQGRNLAINNMNPAGWYEEFEQHSEHPIQNQQNQHASFRPSFQQPYNWSSGGLQHPMYYPQQRPVIGNEGIVKLDQKGWDDQFSVFDSQQNGATANIDKAQTAKPDIVGENEQDQQQRRQQQQQQQLEEKEKEQEENIAKALEEAAAKDPAAMKEFESIWQDLKDQMAKGESEVEDDDGWEDEFGNFGANGMPNYKPDLGDYVFEIENPYLTHDDPLSEAREMMTDRSNNVTVSLSELALCLEAAVQKDPSNSETWMHLGNIQAQNEKEEPAIRALEKAIDVSPGNYSALMSLAVSYTNENYDHAAYQTLERWITEKYPNVIGDAPIPAPATPYELQERVTEMFLKAAQMAPDGQAMDPDVQVGLGILFYTDGDMDKAIDCFFAAVKGRPNDYLLWNRLGATLANNGRSEDAIEAYHKALELCPSFVRARYNLGVSCLNIGCYKESAEHLLTGLSMHKRGGQNKEEGINVSNNLWDMLRKALNMLDRRDLASKAVPGADINLFRNDFEF